MKALEKIYIYRIVYRDNLKIILRDKKINAPNLGDNKNYISIGEEELIQHREEIKVPIEPFGSLKDYVSFYFGERSPMLYCIKNGYDVTKRSQEEIIYLVSSVKKIIEDQKRFVFTDGHAYASFTMFFNDIRKTNNIDWNAVKLKRWHNTEEDPDRKRRKQAEFFVHKSVNLESILAIVVYNQESYNYILNVLKEFNSTLRVIIKKDWYY